MFRTCLIKFNGLAYFTVLVLLAASTAPASAAIIISTSDTAPTADTEDQSNFTTGDFGASSNWAGPPGQTFLVPAGGSYTLDSISLQLEGGNSSPWNGNPFGLRISSVSGTTLTNLLTNESITTPAAPGSTDWVTFTFSGGDVLTLNGGDTYAFSFHSNTNAWAQFEYNQGNPYADGEYFQHTSPATDSTFTNTADFGRDGSGGDLVFVADLTLIPEPASLALLSLAGLLITGRQRRNA